MERVWTTSYQSTAGINFHVHLVRVGWQEARVQVSRGRWKCNSNSYPPLILVWPGDFPIQRGCHRPWLEWMGCHCERFRYYPQSETGRRLRVRTESKIPWWVWTSYPSLPRNVKVQSASDTKEHDHRVSERIYLHREIICDFSWSRITWFLLHTQ
jgi:hypothetical protein